MNPEDRSIELDAKNLLDEAEALIWGLLDENIDAAGFDRLEKMMTNPDVRTRYLQCVELHADLQQLFAQPTPKCPPTSVPVLGSLGDLFPFPPIAGAGTCSPLPE
jgi:hypothetical protein